MELPGLTLNQNHLTFDGGNPMMVTW